MSLTGTHFIFIIFAFLRCIYDSLYYSVVALSNIPSKCSERCRVPSLCYSGSALHFPFNNYSAIFPFGCTGECSRCMFLACMRIFRQHDSEHRQKQFPQLINKLEESDTEETFVLVSRRSESSNLSELLIVLRGKNATNLT